MEDQTPPYTRRWRDSYTPLGSGTANSTVEMKSFQNDSVYSSNEVIHNQHWSNSGAGFHNSYSGSGHYSGGYHKGEQEHTREMVQSNDFRHGQDYMKLFPKLGPFLAIIPTICISIALLVGNRRNWVAPDSTYGFITSNRTVTQVAVQVIAYALSLMNMVIICRLLQYAVRARLSTCSIKLDSLRFWTGMLSQKLYINLPFALLAPLLLFCLAGLIPSAVWTGALTPVEVTINSTAILDVPSYSSTDMLIYNWTERFGSYSQQTNMGLFTYNVGEQYMPHLMNSLATATTVDGSQRVHSKLDNTGYSFAGRSYGVGVSVGLVDHVLRDVPDARGYSYEETGYLADVACIYNTSSAFELDCQEGLYYTVCSAEGFLPNSSPGQAERLEYIVYTPDTIAAMAVTSNPDRPRRMLAIAAGKNYASLNNTQCEWSFTPARFSVSVDFVGQNISVTPLQASSSSSTPAAAEEGVKVVDMEPKGNLTFLANWQFNLMSSDLSSLYSSFLGKSIDENIANYKFAHDNTTTSEDGSQILSDEQAVLGGLEAALEAVMDDLLSGYSGAQLMVANVTTSADAKLSVKAIKFGQDSWIIGAFVFNTTLLLWVVLELVRTRAWRGLESFDFTDPVDMVMGMANATAGSNAELDRLKSLDGGSGMGRLRGRHIGRLRVAQRGEVVMLWNQKT